MDDIQLDTCCWEDVVCPVCLEFPHNSVLIQCSSFDKGCRPFICDTNQSHSNCLDRFKSACGMPSSVVHDAPSQMSASTSSVANAASIENNHPIVSDCQHKLSCPLCRGVVSGWAIVGKARLHLDEKKRSCVEEKCAFSGSYLELQKHAQLKHPHSCPSRIDPARQLDWENFQQSSEIIDVLSTIHSEIPRGMVLGDYVIEYGDGDSGDEFEDFPRDEGNWWTSCILYQAFNNLRSSRNRRRTRAGASRRDSHRLSHDTLNSDESSVTSVEYAEYRLDEIDDEVVSTFGPSRVRSGFRRSQRGRSHFYDN